MKGTIITRICPKELTKIDSTLLPQPIGLKLVASEVDPEQGLEVVGMD